MIFRLPSSAIALRLADSVPFLDSVINFSAKDFTSLAFSIVVETVSCSKSDATKFRRIAKRCSLVLDNLRPATL
jgi:hypothetical protein